MYICGKVLTDSEFEALVVRDENFDEFVKIVSELEKMYNLDNLKLTINGVPFDGEEFTTFDGADNE